MLAHRHHEPKGPLITWTLAGVLAAGTRERP